MLTGKDERPTATQLLQHEEGAMLLQAPSQQPALSRCHDGDFQHRWHRTRCFKAKEGLCSQAPGQTVLGGSSGGVHGALLDQK
jgi:hypothetical protein